LLANNKFAVTATSLNEGRGEDGRGDDVARSPMGSVAGRHGVLGVLAMGGGEVGDLVMVGARWGDAANSR
jgi:hypothetical protein